jgi:oligoendopeptidase F
VTALDLETYRRKAEAFVGALETEHYLHFSGRKPVCDSAAIYDRFPELFTRPIITELERLYELAAADDDKRRLAYLLAFTIEGFLGEQTKHLGDEVANTESQTTIQVDGEAIGLRQASVVQGNEADPARRARIQEARLAATEEHLNPLLGRLWRRSHDLAAELGYPCYKELFSEIKGLDYDLLRAELEGFLRDSAGLYERVMDRLVRERLGIRLTDLTYADLPYLWRAPAFDEVFTAGGLMPSLRATLAGLGIDLDSQDNVHVDTEVRDLKSPRAFCAPVHVPGEIHLVVLPQGGPDDYGALLHEAGHTEHFAHVRPGLSFEYRHLGDNAVTEAFAFTLDHLLINRSWLERVLDFTDADGFLRFATVNDLYFVRRYAAKLAYETLLHAQTGPLDGMAAEYGRRLSEATLVEVPPGNYLADVDEGFYCASYLRAWMLEGALRMILQDRYGMRWFRDPAAGVWLKELWSHGQHFSAEQLLLKHGGGRLSTDPLRHHFERALGR